MALIRGTNWADSKLGTAGDDTIRLLGDPSAAWFLL